MSEQVDQPKYHALFRHCPEETAGDIIHNTGCLVFHADIKIYLISYQRVVSHSSFSGLRIQKSSIYVMYIP